MCAHVCNYVHLLHIHNFHTIFSYYIFSLNISRYGFAESLETPEKFSPVSVPALYVFISNLIEVSFVFYVPVVDKTKYQPGTVASFIH